MAADALFASSLLARATDVAAAWLLTYIVHSTLLLGAAWAVTSSRRVSDATREILWKAALVGGLATASVQSTVSREPLGGQLELASRTGRSTTRELRIALRSEHPGAMPRLLVARQVGTSWTAGLVTLWLSGAGVGLLWLAVAYARTARAIEDRTPLEGMPVARRLHRLLARGGIRRRVGLTCSATIASPVALHGAEVCLPRRALLELEPVELDSMLAHEVAHLVRRDPQWLLGARVIETVLFLQPLNRLARYRMQEAAEFLCDDWAVQRTNEPITLARCLATVAEWVGRAPRVHPVSAMVEGGGSPLVRRVSRILGGDARRGVHSSRGAMGASACALLALAAIAPRISVARSEISDRTVTFVRAVVARGGVAARGDTLVMLHGASRRVTIGSQMTELIIEHRVRR